MTRTAITRLRALALGLMMPTYASAFITTSSSLLVRSASNLRRTSRVTMYNVEKDDDNKSTSLTAITNKDELEDLSELKDMVQHLQQRKSNSNLTREQFQHVFHTIEQETCEEVVVETQYAMSSPARTKMTTVYSLLRERGDLNLFGSSTAVVLPASGSHIVTPTLLEQITSLSMKSLTPKPTSTILLAGVALALLEGVVAAALGWNLNLLVLGTVILGVLDKLLVNGAVLESIVRTVQPSITQKILKHEAGHFLCAYLLGCPVEGCVTSAWSALQDSRFSQRGVSAGTSFFDADLSQEMNNRRLVSRSSLDRYSIIVMGGIAAEALSFGQADGGAGDEMALVAFLSQLGGSWNDATIRNQARWGALQAVLLLQKYKPCHDALAEALEQGGTLGDCVYAIEKAGKEYNLGPLRQPLGYILDEGPYGEWTTDVPANAKQTSMRTDEEALDELESYRVQVEKRIQEIESRIKELE